MSRKGQGGRRQGRREWQGQQWWKPRGRRGQRRSKTSIDKLLLFKIIWFEDYLHTDLRVESNFNNWCVFELSFSFYMIFP